MALQLLCPRVRSLFRRGSAEDLALVERYIRDAFASDLFEANFGYEPTKGNLSFWLSRAHGGLRYDGVSENEAVANDAFLNAIIFGTNIPLLEVKPETGRHYLEPDVLAEAAGWTSQSSLLHLFEYGRSYGLSQRRDRCLLNDLDRWWCELGYVILSPDEVSKLHETNGSVLKASSLSERARVHLNELSLALGKVKRQGRSMFFGTSN